MINLEISSSSQRCSISRYIGIGTYNTDKMEKGKIMFTSTSNFENYENWWYNKFHENSVYNKLEDIGLDINFNKHYNHGIELRFLDHINDNKLLMESFEFIIYLMDNILEDEDNDNIINPIYNEIWNNIVYNIIKDGKKYTLKNNEIEFYEKLLNIKIKDKIQINNVMNVYYYIYFSLMKKYNNIMMLDNINSFKITPIGKFSKLTLNNKIIKTDDLLDIFKTINITIDDFIAPYIIDINKKKINSFWSCCR